MMSQILTGTMTWAGHTWSVMPQGPHSKRNTILLCVRKGGWPWSGEGGLGEGLLEGAGKGTGTG